MSSLSPDPSSDPASASSRSTWYPFDDGAFDGRFAAILIVVLALVVVALAIVTIVRSFTIRAAAPRPPPAPARKQVPVLPAMDFLEGMQEAGAEVECAICLSEFVSGEKVTVLPRCNHIFHASCIGRWLGPCPICRTIFHSPPLPPEKNPSSSELSPV